MKSLLALPRTDRGARAPRLLDRLKWAALIVVGTLAAAASANAQTALADQPVFSATGVPGNLVLALSVEFPTAVTAADRTTTYSSSTKYLGYFDPLKCYTYQYNDGTNGSYFYPSSTASASSYSCSNSWAGNFLNWATMQAVDPFRWALTGGYRAVDTTTTTILEKAWAPSNQGSPSNNFPHKSLTSSVGSVTPFSSGSFYMQVLRCGRSMLFRRSNTAFTNDSACPSSTAWDGVVASTSTTTVYSLDVRVKVCVSGTPEANCVQYGSNYKPEGLIQKYASKIRYSAFGYLNDPTPTGGQMTRDGGVLRARMKFVGPSKPVPGSSPIANTLAEWDSSTGVFVTNPDTADATASSETGSVVSKSGVINYLNQFGLSAQAYKYYDPVSELYYSATRYLRNLGNVAAYSDLTKFNGGTSTAANRTAMKDGFPVITDWTDPILYACQKNFVLGIGDTNTNQDKDLPGNSTYLTNEPTSGQPTDTINVITSTNKVGVIEGMTGSIGATNQYNTSNNSAYIAGMAYQFHTTDIRSDLVGNQTIDTYWLDVLEGGDYKPSTTSGRNQFYLATKYGGFTVPTGYSYATNTTALDQTLWSTNGDTVGGLGARPDNFFVANQADKMVSGLTTAFSRISSAAAATTTSFATSLPQVVQTGNASFSSKYDASNWSGEVTASVLTFDSNNAPQIVTPEKWNFTAKLATQLSGTGWDTSRNVVTWSGTQGVAFRASGSSALSSADQALLDTSYVSGDDHVNFLNYLRGDTTNEAASTASGSTRAYRTRAKLLGDVVGSKARPVGSPSFPFSDTTNAGYSAFKSTYATRRTVVYVGSNDGMMHAINGALATTTTAGMESDANAGKEMFAYVPRALLQGPNNTPNVDGLASLGNPSYVHHFMVNATPNVYDVDFAKTQGASGAADWRSVLIGGLGKGGKAYYALDVTDPTSWTGEAAVAGKVLWEFSNSTTGMSGQLGYTFGDPVVVKTKKYGWVAIFTSGYGNADGKGYLFFVNPKTGALLEMVGTTVGSVTASAGLAHANAFVVDATDGTADAVYAGDLLGNLWRFDVTATTGSYPQPTKLASLTAAADGSAQPVTTSPAIEVHPSTKKRYVMIGTGRLLDQTDISSSQIQSFYAIVDGTNASFSAVPPSPLTSFPVVRSNLVANSNALTGITFDVNAPAGWVEDLGLDTATNTGWRVINDSTTLAGSVAFASILPTIGDVCTPSGSSRVYGRDFASGVTTVKATVSGNLQPVGYVLLGGTVTDLRYISVGGKAALIAGTDTGVVSKIDINPTSSLSLRRLNWRELQTVE
jgi:type IV pilus assembly protein PilY1